MPRLSFIVLLLAGLPAAAWADPDLVQSRNCVSCHAIDKKLVGPSYHDIAVRYAPDKDAENKLVKKIREGGSGSWGAVPMPPNPQLTNDEGRTLVRWILTLR